MAGLLSGFVQAYIIYQSEQKGKWTLEKFDTVGYNSRIATSRTQTLRWEAVFP